MEPFLSTWSIFAVTAMIGKLLCSPVNSSHPTEVTYAELESLGVSCYPFDTCQTRKFRYFDACHCDSMCTVYDTCCVNSEFRVPENTSNFKSNVKCLSVNNNPRFTILMVDSCKDNETLDSLCTSDPEESNDLFLLIPVTSFDTDITYKNYFCAVCNEDIDADRLGFWHLEVTGKGDLYSNLSKPQLKFNKTMDSWTVDDEQTDETFRDLPVTIEIWHSYYKHKHCSLNLVQTCANNWTDEAVASKCRQYMAEVIGSQNVRYRNPHCALSNFELLSNLQCPKEDEGIGVVVINAYDHSGSSVPPSIPLDIPLISLFVLEDRPRRCGKNMVYDKFTDKCRCNSRIYRRENGKCVHKV